MKNKKTKGGGVLKTIINFVFTLCLIGVILAGVKLAGVDGDFSKIINKSRETANNYSDCMNKGNCDIEATIKKVIGESGSLDLSKLQNGKTIDFGKLAIDKNVEGYKGPSSGESTVTAAGAVVKEASESMLSNLKINNNDKQDVGYSRSEWKHWVPYKGNSCWNTREEVLKRDAVPGTIKLLDSSKNQVTKNGCAIGVKSGSSITTEGSGKWIDPYSGETFTNSSKLDIDHIIPLSKAARSGGQKWSKEQKQAFANDLDNLLAVSAKENRSKSDKGPGEYMPSNKKYHCQYAKSYTTIAYKYKLTINKDDSKVLEKTLKACKQ